MKIYMTSVIISALFWILGLIRYISCMKKYTPWKSKTPIPEVIRAFVVLVIFTLIPVLNLYYSFVCCIWMREDRIDLAIRRIKEREENDL